MLMELSKTLGLPGRRHQLQGQAGKRAALPWPARQSLLGGRRSIRKRQRRRSTGAFTAFRRPSSSGRTARSLHKHVGPLDAGEPEERFLPALEAAHGKGRRLMSGERICARLEPAFTRRQPPGDTHERHVCDHCGFVNYQNPKIVVGSVVRHRRPVPVVPPRDRAAPRLLDDSGGVSGNARDAGGRRAPRSVRGGRRGTGAQGPAGGLYRAAAQPGAADLSRRPRLAGIFCRRRKPRRQGCSPSTTYRGARSPFRRCTGPCSTRQWSRRARRPARSSIRRAASTEDHL